jgi:hypothetical protein
MSFFEEELRGAGRKQQFDYYCRVLFDMPTVDYFEINVVKPRKHHPNDQVGDE